MELNPFSISGLILASSAIFLCVILLFYGQTRLHRIWLAFNIVVAIWGLGAFFIGRVDNPITTLWLMRFIYIPIAFIAVFNYHFIYELCQLNEPKILSFTYLSAFVFSFLSLFSGQFLTSSRLVFNSFYYGRGGVLLYIFFILWVCLVLYSHYRLFHTYLKSEGKLRAQILYLLLGTLIGFLGGVTNFFPALGIDLYPWGNFTVPLYCFIVAYAIMKHQLLDIKIMLTRIGAVGLISILILGVPLSLTMLDGTWLRHISLFSIGGLTLAITTLFLCIILMLYGRNKLHWIWMIFNLIVGLWGIGAFYIGGIENPKTALLLWRVVHIPIAFIPILNYHVVYELCGLKEKKILVLAYLQAALFSIFSLFSTQFIPSVRFAFNSFYYDQAGFIFYVFFALWGFFVGYAHIKLFQTLLKSTGRLRTQILYFFLGTMVGFSGGATNFLPALGINFYPFGNFTIPLYCFIVSYAVMKYQLLDIKISITRAGIFIIVYSLVLGIPYGLAILGRDWLGKVFGESWFWLPMNLLLILATAGPFVYLYLQRKAEAALLQEERRTQDLLSRASIGMRTIRNLPRLLELIVDILAKSLRLDNAAIYLDEPEENQYVLKVSKLEHATNIKINKNDPLVQRLAETKLPIVYEELKQFSESKNGAGNLHEIIHQMTELQSSIIIPVILEDILLGFIVLGERKDKRLYSVDLINVLLVMGNQAALAIENCKHIQRMQEEGLAERMVSLDHMASSMAHEIDNPMHIIRTSLSFVKSALLRDPRVAMPEEIKQDFDESLARSLNASERVSSMIKAILDYSRMGTGKLESIRVSDALEGFLQLIQPQIREERVQFAKEIENDLPPVLGDRVQMEEVFMNFVRNSLHAVRRNEEKKISLKIFRKNETIIRIECSDNGYGIPGEIINDIFLSSMTTKGSTEGTGLGLFRVRKIVDIFRGKVWAESEGKGKGATFIVELPVYSSSQKTQG